jgi:hypothetical protein
MANVAPKNLGWFQTRVVGTQYYKVGHVPGQVLHFERNHVNRHDANAIEAQNGKGQVLGHLPRQDSAWLAPLIDRGSIYLKGESDDAGDEWQIPVRVNVHQDPGGQLVAEAMLPGSPGAVIHNHLLSVYETAGTLTAEIIEGLRKLYEPMICGDGIFPETRLLYALLASRLAVRRQVEEDGLRKMVEEFLATIDFGAPVSQAGMTVVPLFRKAPKTCAYESARAALKKKTLVVEEVDEHGQVSLLRAINHGKKPVFLPEGEGLRGAKQDRIVNISIIIAVGATVEIPVSCVERGRWGFSSHRHFESGHYACSSVRYSLKESVHASIRSGHGYGSDQDRVWGDVDRMAEETGSSSPTANLNEVFENARRAARPDPAAFPFPEKASGLAIFFGAQLVSVDMFAHPKLAEELWIQIIGGAAFNVPEKPGEPPPPAKVRDTLSTFFRAILVHVADPEATPGRGHYLRSESRAHAAGILFDGQTPVHLSGFVRQGRGRDEDNPIIVF